MAKLNAGIVLVCAVAIAISGCTSARPAQKVSASVDVGVEELSHQHAALDAYVEVERSSLQAIEQQFDGMFSEVTVTGIYPGTIAFGYVYAEEIDPAAAQDHFDSMLATLQTVCDTQVFPAMDNAGVTESPMITYTYYNADSSEIWSHTFEPS